MTKRKPRFPRPKAVIRKREGLRGVLCRCDRWTPFGGYATAQMAMGHVLDRNCPCGLGIKVERGFIVYQQEGHIL